MSLFYNNYQRLVQENNDAIAKISGESWSTLCKMFEYMRFYNISLFELEVLKKDLLGAAREELTSGISWACRKKNSATAWSEMGSSISGRSA